MKPLLLPLVAFSIPAAAALAQQGTPAPANKPEEKLIIVHLRLPSGWVVAQPSYLYRSLHDARLGRYAHRVRKGEQVVDAGGNASNARWLKVTQFNTSDTAIYYMPASATSYQNSAPQHWALH